MKTLQKRLAGLYTATAGVILLLVIFAFLLSSIQKTRDAQQAQFQMIWNSLTSRFQSANALSHGFLAQTEADYQIVIHIRENGTPFFYPGSWQPDTSRDVLIQRAMDMAGQEGVFMDLAPVSSTANTSSRMNIPGDHGDHYLAQVLVIPARHGVKSICVIAWIPPVFKALKGTILSSCLLAALGVICLWGFSWKFVGWSLKPAEESQRKQAQFIAAASHELRSPLAVLRSGISAMAAAPQKKDTLLPLLESECVRMARLIDDMLLLASADGQTWSIHWETVEMDTLLIDLYEAFLPACREKGLSFSLDLPDEPLPPIQGDPERLRQLLMILLDNAKSFTPSGRSVTLSARADEKKRVLTLKVLDEGCGIPLESRPFIFDRFYQADSARQDKQHFGLGLSIAKELAALHRGKLSLSDGLNGGSCFTLLLPFHPCCVNLHKDPPPDGLHR